MPSDDLILSLKQIAGYPSAASAVSTDSIIMQRGGLGGPYAEISPTVLVATALAQGGDMAIGGKLAVQSIQSGSAQFSNAAVNLLSAQKACVVELAAQWGTVNGVPIASTSYVDMSFQNTVHSFEGRQGDVCLWIQDILRAGGAPNFSPVFGGCPRAPTPPLNSCNSRIATTAFTQQVLIGGINHLLADHPFVFTFNGRTGDVVLTAQDIIDAGGSGEIFNNPVFTGIPLAPTAPPGTSTEQIATTQFVMTAIAGGPFAPLNSPVFTGTPSGPTAPPGSSTGQFATTAFVQAAVSAATAGVASFNTRTGAVVLESADITSAGGALLVSPQFTGNPTAPTQAPGDNDTSLATTAFVQTAVAAVAGGVTSFNSRSGAITLLPADITGAGGAPLASPAFLGTPTAPTATPNTSTTQVATTAFVMNELANAAVQSFNGRVGAVTLTSADISAAGGAALQSPSFLGTPTAPTPAPGTNSTQIATTAYVLAALTGAGVTSFNTRTGAVILQLSDITSAGGAPLASPAFSGVPTGPTAPPGNSSQQFATTAFVTAALAGGAGVSSFNTRTGSVTLLAGDITGAGGALLSSPALTGSPTAPTATSGNSSTVIATTAFVQNAITTGSVAAFNGRVGSVTLNTADISAAGGAVLASPAFTGTPTGPTATAGTNSGQLATTAFVATALAAAGGVTSFNGRAGVVTLTTADITGAGGVTSDSLAGYLPLTGGTVTGQTTFTSNSSNTITLAGATSTNLYLNKPNGALGTVNQIIGQTNGSARWVMALGSAEQETGSNAGSNFALTRFSDAAAQLGVALSIARSTGAASFSAGATFGGSVTATGFITGGTQTVTTGGINFNVAGVSGAGTNFAFGYQSAPVGYGAILPYVNGGNQGYMLRSNPSSGVYFGVTLLQSPAAQTTLFIVNDGGNSLQWSVTASDARLKRNLKAPSKDALQIVNAIEVDQCDFELPKSAKEHWDFTMLAEEVEKLLPYAYMPAPKDGYSSLHPLHLITVLWKAVQQLSERVDALQARTA